MYYLPAWHHISDLYFKNIFPSGGTTPAVTRSRPWGGEAGGP